MELASLLPFDHPDLTPRRRFHYFSLRGIPLRCVARPGLRSTTPFSRPFACCALRPGGHEETIQEKWNAEVHSVPQVTHRIGLSRSVAVSPPFGAQSGQVGLNGWFGVGVGFLFACLLQFVMTKFRNGTHSESLIKQARRLAAAKSTSSPISEDGETIEWVNMCWRKIWRVYQQGLERWLAGVLQPAFDKVVREGAVPRILKGIKIVEMTFDHQAPYFTNLRRRTSRKDSDLNGVVDVRYTGGARMLLMLEVGGGRWLVKVPVLVSDLDLECQLWLKVRLAPLTPYLGTLSFAFVGPPNVKVQLAPYNSVRLMRIPVLQNFLTRLLTKVLPGYMVLPKRLNINIPPAITAVAEAAVGRDAVMKAVASAVLQADALEQSLLAVLPLGPQSAAGGITLPKSFQGELSVALIQGRNLPVWGFPWQSNPYCRLTLGKQAVTSKRENDTGTKGGHRRPIWNQEFEFLVENLQVQTLEVYIKDSHITGRPEVGKVEFPLSRLPRDGSLSIWLPVQQVVAGQEPMGELQLDISYKPFVDEDYDSGYFEAEKHARELEDLNEGEITDIKSAAAASSKAAAAASAAFSAIAITRAAAARAAHKAQNAAVAAAKIASLRGITEEESDLEDEEVDFDPDTYNLAEIQPDQETVSQNGAPVSSPSEEADLEREMRALSLSPDSFVEHTQANGLTGDVNEMPFVDVTPLPLEVEGEAVTDVSSHTLHSETVEVKTEADLDTASTAEETRQSLPVPAPSHCDNSRESTVTQTETEETSLDHTISSLARQESSKKRRERWWMNVIRRRHGSANTQPSPAESTSDKLKTPTKKDRIRWWMWLTSSIAFWRTRSQIISGRNTSTKSRSKSSKETRESVLLPPDLPLEEIAKEVVKLKTVTDKDEEERMNRMYAEAVERSDRKWIMLLCFLIVISIGLLSVVAIRIGPL